MSILKVGVDSKLSTGAVHNKWFCERKSINCTLCSLIFSLQLFSVVFALFWAFFSHCSFSTHSFLVIFQYSFFYFSIVISHRPPGGSEASPALYLFLFTHNIFYWSCSFPLVLNFMDKVHLKFYFKINFQVGGKINWFLIESFDVFIA